jgi:hypothetical protein
MGRLIVNRILPLAFIIAAFLLVVVPADAGNCYFYSVDVGYVCDGRVETTPEQFQAPAPREGSLLNYTTYVYLEDNINVYAAPSMAAPIVYNVGNGFLYATIHGQQESEGITWYKLNQDEYVRQEDVRLVQTPEFHGVKITVQPERPFGWVVQNVTPSNEPDGEPDEAFAELTRFTFFEVFDAVEADEEWIWYDIGGGRWIRQTYVSLVDLNRRPEDVGENEFWVEVDLYEQTFAAYEGDRMVYASLVSSGLNQWPTREGIFQVWSRYTQNKMSGADGEIDYYFIEDVPYIMYFDQLNEIALHGAYWHDRYGYKHSHGCVNMPPLDAEWVYYWSADGPNDLWVWVHTSEPHHYFDKFG